MLSPVGAVSTSKLGSIVVVYQLFYQEKNDR